MGRFYRSNVKIIFIILAVLILLGVAVYFGFFHSEKCYNFECFQNNLDSCDKASYINEGGEATWYYKILGKSSGRCEIKVTLLQAKEGELGIEELEGREMVCKLLLGDTSYPEKNLGLCNGFLKEGLQDIIIENLNKYVVDNVGELSKELSSV